MLAAVVVVQQRLLSDLTLDPTHFQETLGGVVAKGTLAGQCFADHGGSLVILAPVIGAAFHLIQIILPFVYCIYSTIKCSTVGLTRNKNDSQKNFRKALQISAMIP